MAQTSVSLVTILALCLTSCSIGSSSVDSTAISTDICSIVVTPKAYDGRRVVIHACVSSDEYEYTFLFDERAACVRSGLTPLEGKHLRGVTLTKDKCGDFTGLFYYDERPTIVSQTHKFYIDKVANLSTRRGLSH
jgi:hypothetical protein